MYSFGGFLFRFADFSFNNFFVDLTLLLLRHIFYVFLGILLGLINVIILVLALALVFALLFAILFHWFFVWLGRQSMMHARKWKVLGNHWV